MTVVPPSLGGRGIALLASHVLSPAPDALSARERLAAAIGTELADKLVHALSTDSSPGHARFAA